ncbi:MAG: helix-turn-helix transcriptional regulator [Clostridia bacterium]|nr:helix-turn-helix transcriptional regulator [Clostridia bacterium]
MHIGERVKALRLSKWMTQADLAGGHITRNMLSSIEHGTALPSLPTAVYLAQRLNVPVGYLLAEPSEEFFYRKMANIANIRKAFTSKDYIGCLSLLTAMGDEQDDELWLLRAECEYGVGQNALEGGHLRHAAAAWDRALNALEKTVYRTAWLRERIAVCFRYLADVSATLVSDVLDAEEIEGARALGDPLVEYAMAVEAIEADHTYAAEEFIRRHPDTLYADRLRALLLMGQNDYMEAQRALEQLLNKDELTFGVLLYEVFGDLEICYRKNDDYKRAYEFSGSRLGLLERLLEEV